MTAPAAVMGDYCDLKFIKSRKVAQVIVEIPIEASAAFVAAFGTPSQATGVPVAIARIDPKAASETAKPSQEPSTKDKKIWRDLRPSQQAGMRCNEPAFWGFLYDKYDSAQGTDAASNFVRDFCGVKTRADILEGTRAAQKWADLDREYTAWLRV